MTGRDELAAHASRGKPRRNSGALTAALVGLVTVVALETMSVAAILPLVTAELGRIDLYGWVYSGLALGQIVGIVVAGRWADRANPSRPLVAGLALYVVGLSIAALAPSMVLLVAGRVVQGFGAGAVPSVVYVCVGRGFSEAERPRIFAMMSTAWVVPSLIGPVLASLVAESVGWRWVFAGVIPVAVVFGVVGRREILRLDASPNDGQSVDAVALGAMVVGTGVALGGFQARSGWLAAAMVIGGGAAALVAFRRLTPAGTLRVRPGLPAVVAVRGLLTAAFFAGDGFVSLAVVELRSTSTTFAGAVVASGSLTWTLGSWLQARLMAEVGARRLVGAGIALIAVGYPMFGVAAESDGWRGLMFVGPLVAGFGMGLAYAPLSAASLSQCEPGREGAATSALQLSDVTGVTVGTGLAGVLLASDVWDGSLGAGLAAVWSFATAVAVLGVIGSRGLPGPRTVG